MIRIGTYNVRGLSGKADLVQKLFDNTELDVIGLTETWQRPTDRFLLPLQYSAIALEQPGRLNQGNGGIALACRQGLSLEVVLRVAKKEFQMLVARTATMTIALTYISPSNGAEYLKQALKTAHQEAEEPLLLLGDFNA